MTRSTQAVTLDPTTNVALAEAVRRLVDVYSPQLVYLFGSAARGDAGPDSDYDILVVLADDAPAELRRARKGYEALWGLGEPVDIVVWTRREFDRRLHLRASLPATVVREGLLLHAA
ncbi:MAG TPA: nucleotidyltransferase domain-containing protein [Thermoleophilia bacterium]|nr:nucleotidyltransferase domain-containing protein [Thermoleophilia bacterium]